MKRIKRLTNISNETIMIYHDHLMTEVPPGGTMENIGVANLDEVKEKVTVTMDLGEINETGRKTKLRD